MCEDVRGGGINQGCRCFESIRKLAIVRTHERQLPKLNVEGSNPFGRSKPDARPRTHVRVPARLARGAMDERQPAREARNASEVQGRAPT